MTLGYRINNETFQNAPFMPLPVCTKKYRDINQFWNGNSNTHPRWLSCGFKYIPASKHTAEGTNLEIWDFSISSGGYDYSQYFKRLSDMGLIKYKNYTNKDNTQKLQRWFSPGYVEPLWVARDPIKNLTATHYDLFRLAASANIILQKKTH